MEPSISDLLDKYLTGTLTGPERELLVAQLRIPEHLAELERILDAGFQGDQITGLSSPAQASAMYQKVLREIRSSRSLRIAPYKWIAAASILLLLAAGWVFLLRPHTTNPAFATAIAPGTDKATLTLADGTIITLDSTAKGQLAQQAGSKINQVSPRQLAYSPSSTNGPLVYNTLSTPRGGQFQLRLPDGSKVWLNAASSITYPVAFNTKQRVVDITGEAYFEIAKDPSKPFIVRAEQTATTVLGTEFNINAYSDEKDIRTTLVNGAVKFSAPSAQKSPPAEKLLRPGYQTLFDPRTRSLTMQPADVEQVIAWKNGLFEFDHTDLGTIMRQISRWYDVDIRFETAKYDSTRFGGGLSRKLNLSYTLRLLETNGIHIKTEAKKIIIIP